MGENRKEQVRERYAGVVRAIRDAVSGKASCCEPSSCGSEAGALEADMSGGSYSEAEKRELPRLVGRRCFFGLRQPGGAGGAIAGGGYLGPWQRRRDRRAAFGPTGS